MDTKALFDEHGRRIPYDGLRVHNQVSRRYFRLVQPAVDYATVLRRTIECLRIQDPPVSSEEFAGICGGILDSLRGDAALANLTKGVHVPFLCPPAIPDRAVDLRRLLDAVNCSFTGQFPQADFMDLCQGKPDDSAKVSAGSRYEKLERARTGHYLIGVYFPDCLSEFDLASQRKQMDTLPQTVADAAIVLSGPAEAAAAFIGSPDLLVNEASYPHHLCLSAIQEPEDKVVYTFEAYGNNLRFRYRSNMLTPEVTQVSEQWAGGLTVFTVR